MRLTVPFLALGIALYGSTGFFSGSDSASVYSKNSNAIVFSPGEPSGGSGAGSPSRLSPFGYTVAEGPSDHNSGNGGSGAGSPGVRH